MALQEPRLRLGNGGFAVVKNRRRQNRRGMAFANAVDQMVKISHPAAGNDRDRQCVGDTPRKRQVKSLPRTIPIHGGQQNFTGAIIGHPLGPSDNLKSGGVTAAMGKDFIAAG